MEKGYVYILSNYRRTSFRIGVTKDLAQSWQNRRREDVRSFVTNTHLQYLVYFEQLASMRDAYCRRRELTGWSESSCVNLIRSINPYMMDLSWAVG